MSGRRTAPPAPPRARGSWLDGLFAERQVYVRGRGQPHFVTVTRRARVARAAGLALLVLAVAGLGSALALGYREYDAARRELAALQRAGGAAPARAPEAAGEELAARDVAARSRAAELEAARARAALLAGQLAAAERARDEAAAELRAARAQAEAERTRLAAERDRLRGELERAARAAAAAATPVNLGAGPQQPQPREAFDAALARVKDLDAALTEARRRNAELEAYVGRRAPPPPGSAPR